jgi:DNA-binding MarR family transcriptional regulator
MSRQADRVPGLVVDQPGGNVALDLFVLTGRVGELLDHCLAGTGLSATLYAVYTQLEQRSHTPSQLSSVLGIRPTTLSGYLAAMQRAGDITRRRNAADGRSWEITMTDAGRAKVGQARPRVRRAVRSVNTMLGTADDVLAVREALGRVDAAVRQARHGAG